MIGRMSSVHRSEPKVDRRLTLRPIWSSASRIIAGIGRRRRWPADVKAWPSWRALSRVLVEILKGSPKSFAYETHLSRTRVPGRSETCEDVAMG